jgi:hypothetical protein
MTTRRMLADPTLCLDTETFLQLVPVALSPTAELLSAIEECLQKLEGQRRISPAREALVSAGGIAVWLFLLLAADGIRDEPGAWWRFVLAFLHAAKFPIERLYHHPESLRPQLAELYSAAGPFATIMRPYLTLPRRSEAAPRRPGNFRAR